MGVAKPCTHLHPAPFTSTHLYPPPPSSIHIHLAFYNTLNIIRTKISHVIGQFPQLQVMIPDTDLDILNFDLKFVFGQIWAKKVKIVGFTWQLSHIISWKSWFQIRS